MVYQVYYNQAACQTGPGKPENKHLLDSEILYISLYRVYEELP